MPPPMVELTVECYAGYQADQEPRAFTLDGQRQRVLGIARRWYEPRASCFEIRAEDGCRYLLRHDSLSDRWWLLCRTPADS